MDQIISTEMDEDTDKIEGSLCKSKFGQQDDNCFHHWLHHGSSDPCIGILLFYAPKNRGSSYGV